MAIKRLKENDDNSNYKTKLTIKQQESIFNMYSDGKSILNISKELKIGYDHIRNLIIFKYGSLRKNDFYAKKYDFDSNFFKDINTEEKAYWLGFIHADGYILTDRDVFGIALSDKDIEHLEKLKKSLKSNHKIMIYKNNSEFSKNNYCRLTITNKENKINLINNGVVPNKTNILKFPNIQNELINHFIRGYIDGDGSIYATDNAIKKGCISVSVLGTEDFLNTLRAFLPVEENVKLRTRKEGQVVKELRIGGKNKTIDILNYIYKDATIYLDRKFELYQKILNHYR